MIFCLQEKDHLAGREGDCDGYEANFVTKCNRTLVLLVAIPFTNSYDNLSVACRGKLSPK